MKANKKDKLEIYIFAFASFGEGLSGGDNIFIELAKCWSSFGTSVIVFVFEDGCEICRRSGLAGVEYRVCKAGKGIRFLPLLFVFRTLYAIIAVLREKSRGKPALVYSASDFWPDSIPAFIFSRMHRYSQWIAGFYMFAPRPFKADFPYRGLNVIRGILYYVTQVPIFLLVKRFADFVFVTSEPDVEKFVTKRRARDDIVVVKGGIDLELVNSVPEPPSKQFDAVFMGRFHPQKGILELVDIWDLVVKKRPRAKLAIIGDGYLRSEIEAKIRQHNLGDRIVLFGYKFGKEKVEIFRSSRVVLHPATYDSGGMSSCEAMSCGLPGVSFDLEALRTYYPKGMLKAKCFDFQEFADNIIRLLTDKELYYRLSKDSLDLVWEEWDWDKRSRVVYDCLTRGAGEK